MTSIAIIGSRGYPSTYGGFETFVSRFAPYMRDSGVDVTVYCRDRSMVEGSRVDEWEGIRRIHSKGWDTRSASTLTHGFSCFRDARQRAFDAALVLNVANGFFLPMLRNAGTPTAVNVDGLEWERGKWGKVARRVFLHGAKSTARYADEIVVDSNALRDVWQYRFGRSSTYIPYGGDVFDRATAELDQLASIGVPPGAYVLVVARLVPENNVDLALDALKAHDFEIPAVVVGSAGIPTELEERLRALSTEHEDFHWLGHVDDQRLLQQLWQHCALYVHGHSAGGTNPALLQALGCGAPTIAFDSVFNREVLTGSDDCFFSGDEQTLAKMIGEIVTDPGRRAEMSIRNQQIAADRFSWGDVFTRYESLLLALAEQGPRSRVRQ